MHSPALVKQEVLSVKVGMVPQNLPRDTTHAFIGAVPGEIHDGSRYQLPSGSFMHVPTVTAAKNGQQISAKSETSSDVGA